LSVKEIIADAKKQKGPLQRIMEERSSEAQTEYEETKIRRLIAEEKNRINEIKGTGAPMQPGLASSFTSKIMQLAQVDPAKAQAFIKGLGQEDLNKMAFLMAAESDQAGSVLRLAQSSGTSVKDLVEIVKLIRPNNGGTDLKGVAEVFKLGIEAAKANNPNPTTTANGYKEVMAIVQPFVEALKGKEAELYEAKLVNIEQRIPASLPDQLQHYKDMAIALGMGDKTKNSMADLKLEEMRQSHDVDMQRITWEQKKFILEQEADRNKWDRITDTLSPILQMNAPVIQKAVRDIAKSVTNDITSSMNNPSQPNPQSNLAKFTCPSCQTELNVPIPPNAPEVIPVKCPKCNTVSPAQLGPPPEQARAPPQNQTQHPQEEPPQEEHPPTKRSLGPTYT
jgi:hypothetical protein